MLSKLGLRGQHTNKEQHHRITGNQQERHVRTISKVSNNAQYIYEHPILNKIIRGTTNVYIYIYGVVTIKGVGWGSKQKCCDTTAGM